MASEDIAFNKLYFQARQILLQKKITIGNLVELINPVMEMVGSLEDSSLLGIEKKALVIRIINKIIQEELPDNEETEVLKKYATGYFIESTIDTLYFVAKNNNKYKKQVDSLFKRMFKCC